jgi:hypothetical protein
MVKFRIFEKLLKPSGGTRSGLTKSKSSKDSLLLDESDAASTHSSTELSLARILNDEFSCNCCLELLKRPVTLACGHSFCQLCLANWYLASLNNTCPSCRQEWKSLPKVNSKLKSSIEKLARYELTLPSMSSTNQRSSSGSDSLQDYLANLNRLNKDEKKILKKFEDKYKSRNSGAFNLFRNLSEFNLNYDHLNANSQDTESDDNIALDEYGDFADSDMLAEIGVPQDVLRRAADQQPNTIEYSLRSSLDAVSHFVRGIYPYIPLVAYGFIFGLLTVVPLLVIFWLVSSNLSYKVNFASNIGQLRNKYSKVPETWTQAETQEWFYQLGPWTTEIANIAQLNNFGEFFFYIHLIKNLLFCLNSNSNFRRIEIDETSRDRSATKSVQH